MDTFRVTSTGHARPSAQTAALRSEAVKHGGSQKEEDLRFPILGLPITCCRPQGYFTSWGPDTHPQKPSGPSTCMFFGGQRHVQGESR